MTASDRDALRRQLTRHEGTGPMKAGHYLPYWDCCGKGLRACRCTPRHKGKLSIGIGFNIEDVGISEATKDQILDERLDACIRELARRYPWFVDLDPVRQSGCVDFLYNVGVGTFLQFRRFIAAMERRAYDSAADELIDSDWFRQVGHRGPRVVRMIRTGMRPV